MPSIRHLEKLNCARQRFYGLVKISQTSKMLIKTYHKYFPPDFYWEENESLCLR